MASGPAWRPRVGVWFLKDDAPRDAPSFQRNFCFSTTQCEKRMMLAGSGFSKKSRLLKATEFKAVFANAQFKVSCRYFLVLAIGNDLLSPRLGLVIAKKHVATAVQRNRIKRQIRDSFRHSSDLAASVDVIVLTRKNADKLNNQQLSDKIAILWQDLNSKIKQQH